MKKRDTLDKTLNTTIDNISIGTGFGQELSTIQSSNTLKLLNSKLR